MVESIDRKIFSLEALLHAALRWRLKSEKVVFTNGVFDILHPGHVDYLARAAQLGNRLVIGLNSDSSVKRLGKGAERPINTQLSRAQVLAALASVDAVVVFDEDTPLNLIEAIKPEVLAKGGDYDASEVNREARNYIVGSDVVRALGGSVYSIPFLEGHSSTTVINKIKGIG